MPIGTASNQAHPPSPKRGQPPVVAQGLTKIFKDFWMRDRARAVDDITFTINQGEIFGLLGPNGSGKSTTIKIILGLLKKSSGRLGVFGQPPTDVAIKKRIGYLPEESYLYPFLNARETLEYYAKLFQLNRSVRAKRIDELLDMVGLTAVQHRQVREYSKGMQRRIGLAQALINDPEFLILDEPTTGLDPIGTRQVKDLIIQLGQRGKTVLLSSHLLSDVEDCVDRMVILYGGKIRAEGTCDDLLTAQSRSIIETDALDLQTTQEIESVLNRHGRTLEKISKPRQRLEDLFIDIVEKAQEERTATSGATHAGATAAFLVGEAATGEDLIEHLISTPDDDVHHPVQDEPIEQHAVARTTDDDHSLIDELLKDGTRPDAPPSHTEKSEPSPTPTSKQRTDAPTASPGVDEDVIGSLLDDDPSGDGGKG